jgi:hypothetical protein
MGLLCYGSHVNLERSNQFSRYQYWQCIIGRNSNTLLYIFPAVSYNSIADLKIVRREDISTTFYCFLKDLWWRKSNVQPRRGPEEEQKYSYR